MTTASDPHAALAALRTGAYDAAVIDHEMRMTCMDLIVAIREDELTEGGERTMKPRALIYCRVSSVEQVEGQSLSVGGGVQVFL